MSEEFEAWAALIERVGFSAAIIGMIAYAIRSASKWAAPVAEKMLNAHVQFVEGTHNAVASIKETVSQQAQNGVRVADTLESLNKAVSVKLDKHGAEYSDHVFSNVPLVNALDPAADFAGEIATHAGMSPDKAQQHVAKIKGALRG